MDKPPALIAEDVEVWFGSAPALQGVSVSLSQGVTALLGENGAGKTTLMRTLVGLISPRSGTLYAAGAALHTRSAWREFGSSVGYMPQAVPVLRHMTVAQYLGYLAYLKGVSRTDAVTEVSTVLARVNLADRAHARTTKLSGGMRRRLGLAVALLGDPQVVLLDEPTVGLDPTQRREMRAIVRQIGEERAVLLSTHLAEDVAAIADHVIVLDQGRAIYSGTLAHFSGGGEREVSAAGVEQAFLDVVRGGAS